MKIAISCPICRSLIEGLPSKEGCRCGFTTSGLAGKGTGAFQQKKDSEHRDLLYGRDIQLYKKPINTSFDFYGDANLVDIVDYALMHGQRGVYTHRGKQTEVIVAYIPNIIGSGITKIDSGVNHGSSGICLMSPQSVSGFEHSFAVLDNWVNNSFSGQQSKCSVCGQVTPFGFAVCPSCFAKNGNSWMNFINPDYTIKM